MLALQTILKTDGAASAGGFLKVLSAEFGPETFGNWLISLFPSSDYPQRASLNLPRKAPTSLTREMLRRTMATEKE